VPDRDARDPEKGVGEAEEGGVLPVEAGSCPANNQATWQAGPRTLSGKDPLDGFEAGSSASVERDLGGRSAGMNEVDHGLEELQYRFGLTDAAADDHDIPRLADDCLLDLVEG
jgi:hypothetical protein